MSENNILIDFFELMTLDWHTDEILFDFGQSDDLINYFLFQLTKDSRSPSGASIL